MAARWATTYKVYQPWDEVQSGWKVDKDEKYFDMKRKDLGQPIRALIAVSAWRREDGAPEKLKTAFGFASSTYDLFNQKEIPTDTLLLDGAALVLAGTTSELDGLLNDMAQPTWHHKVLTISAPKPDKLCLAYARIVQKRVQKGTDTVVVIAPMDGWWMKGDGVKKPEDIYSKDPKSDGGWRPFGHSAPQQIFDLKELKGLLKQGKGEKAWIKAKEEYFKDENSA
jgi:hypothetical protein